MTLMPHVKRHHNLGVAVLMTAGSKLYIDSRYNTFPIVEYEWENSPMDE